MRIETPLALPQAPSGSSGLVFAADVATVVIAVAMLVLVLLAGLLVLRINGMLKELRLSMRQNMGPVSDRARSISDNVEFITQAVRTDVEQLNGSVKALTDRLQLASERMEERIEEFNALMEVVQGEAEDLFLDTASTVRGVREGARAISRSVARDEGDDADARPELVDEFETPVEENALAGDES